MPRTYSATGTSRITGDFEDIELKQDTDRRLVLRAHKIANQHDRSLSINGSLIHQRRHSRNEEWQDVDNFNLANLRAGQEVRISLDAEGTHRLMTALADLYELPNDGWVSGTRRNFVVLDDSTTLIDMDRKQEIVEALLAEDGAQLLDFIAKQRPDLLEMAARLEQHEERQRVVEEFEEHLHATDWDETQWQRFFDKNTWIFGHNLVFQILDTVQSQAYVGGRAVSGSGSQLADMLMATAASARFTVLVDIKRPDSQLLGSEYRNRVYSLGKELVGGVSQLQSYCRTWVTEGSRQEDTQADLEEESVFTYEPRAILVVGHTEQLTDRHKQATFELFRRNLHNPEIITYDELLERARYTVELQLASDS